MARFTGIAAEVPVELAGSPTPSPSDWAPEAGEELVAVRLQGQRADATATGKLVTGKLVTGNLTLVTGKPVTWQTRLAFSPTVGRRRAEHVRPPLGRADRGPARGSSLGAGSRCGVLRSWLRARSPPRRLVAWPMRASCCRRRSMHTSNTVTLAVAVFLASAVESVEALTIIVAAGVSRGWRSALEGTAVALLVLAVLVGALGPALVYLVPIDVVRVVIGALLLVYGLQWLRKAILRSVGLKAKHDEDAIFRQQVEALSVQEPADMKLSRTATSAANGAGSRPKRDATGFTVAFKGTFLEGLEVVIIVLGLGGEATSSAWRPPPPAPLFWS